MSLRNRTIAAIPAMLATVSFLVPTALSSAPASAVTAGTDGKIAYTATDGSLKIINPDGTQKVQLAPSGESPTFSPDGLKVAYLVGGQGDTDIWVVSADGSDPTQITTDGGYKWGLAWSPDGTKLAYGTLTRTLWTVAPTAGATPINTGVTGQNPDWSPNGLKFTYEDPFTGAILTKNADGSGSTTTITPSGAFRPHWSPNGAEILVYKPSSGLIRFKADGTGTVATALASAHAPTHLNTWSPSGSRIAVNLDNMAKLITATPDGATLVDVPGDEDIAGVNSEGIAWGVKAKCNGKPATHEGTAGNDTINGTSGDDVILAWSGDDDINGLGGHDTICAMGGNDTVDGGDGNDWLDGGAGTDMLTFESATAGVTAELDSSATGAGSDTLAGFENLTGSPLNDLLGGDPANNIVIGGAGTDVIDGGDGIDEVSYADHHEGVTVTLGTPGTGGNSTSDGSALDSLANIENVTGSPFNDALTGNAAANLLSGGAGNDMLVGGDGPDGLYGGADSDTVSYAARTTAVKANLSGGTGDDGGAEDGATGARDSIGTDVERLDGGAGSDTLSGNTLANTLVGGAGNDTLVGGNGRDGMYGGSGTDTVSYSTRTTAVRANLSGGTGDDGGAEDGATGARDSIGTDVERLYGGASSDALSGNSLANYVSGLGGNDTLVGGAGNDGVAGGDGNDTLIGSTGADTLDGGAGVDTVSYTDRTTSASGVSVTIGSGANDGNASDGPSTARDNVTGTVENAIGGAGNDILYGSALANRLTGMGGADKFYGNGGNDALVAKDGIRDLHISGGTGTDAVSRDATDPTPIGVP